MAIPARQRKDVIFIVDDDQFFCSIISKWFEKSACRLVVCRSGEECLKQLKLQTPRLILLDLYMPGISGLEVLEQILALDVHIPVVMLSASDDIDTAVKAMRLGASDYISKPAEKAYLLDIVEQVLKQSQKKPEPASKESAEVAGYGALVGDSPAMKGLFNQLKRIADSSISVLIYGESGTGKELVARMLHKQSRPAKPFIAINCAAIPSNLIESELFGHEKGAFTGAVERRRGRFEEANGGTLFLDEVAEIDITLQAKLLRVLQERSFTRVGGSQVVRSSFRLIAATHRDLLKASRRGQFREDLFFRLAVFDLEIPPLRDRGDDVYLLSECFIDLLAREENISNSLRLSPQTREVFRYYEWPGNVRELQNAIHRALVVVDKDVIEPSHLPNRILASLPDGTVPAQSPAEIDDREAFGLPIMSLAELERLAITSAMRRHDNEISKVVDELGVGRSTLYRKLKQYQPK